MGKQAGDVIQAPGETNIQVFTTSGTWNKPNGVRAARVRVVGGGGGSGGCTGAASQAAASGGGGGGGYTEALILAANLNATETVTIGTGGAAGASGNNAGGTGGASSFGTHCSGLGGTGGSGSTSTTGTLIISGGTGGSGSGGDLMIPGSDGGAGMILAGATARGSNYGGASQLGGSARPSAAPNIPVTGKNYAGGGAGISTTATAGAGSPGAPGVVIVESIF